MYEAQILDVLPFGVAVLDTRGRIKYSNRRASELLRTGDELNMNDGVLAAGSGAHTRALSEALQGLAKGTTVGPVGFTIARTNLHSLSIALVTIPPRSGSASHRSLPKILAIICDPDLPPQLPVPLLTELFRFTAVQASVATLMLQFTDTNGIAEKLAISHDTVRKHFQDMFSKTQCGNQSELLHILLSSPASLLLAAPR